jgi:hypothetical protein
MQVGGQVLQQLLRFILLPLPATLHACKLCESMFQMCLACCNWNSRIPWFAKSAGLVTLCIQHSSMVSMYRARSACMNVTAMHDCFIKLLIPFSACHIRYLHPHQLRERC